MKQLIQAICLCGAFATLAVGCGSPVNAPDGGNKLVTLASHTPQVAQGAQRQAALPTEQALSLRVVFALQNESDLDTVLGGLYNPSSPSYQSYLTPEQFGAEFHPSADQVNQVRAALADEGIDSAPTAHGLFLDVNTTVGKAQSFFHTQLYNYVEPDGTTIYAPASQVQVAANLPITGVFGLHTPPTYHSHMAKPQVTPLAQGLPPGIIPTAGDIRTVYQIPATATGKGQLLGLLELDGYDASDVATYVQNNSINPVPLHNILIGTNGAATGSGADEVTLDIEMMNALAPNANQIRVYEGTDFPPLLNEMANPTMDDKQMFSVISCSWGAPETQSAMSDLNAENSVFKQMAAQGQSFFAAAGDSGAKDDGRNIGVDDPGSQPYVIAVGGTSITLQNNGATYGSETTWTDGGGGISTLWPIPSWQVGAATGATKGSTTMRNSPDVSLDADPATGYAFFSGGQEQVAGGTSFAAPLWAAFTALVNEQRAASGLGPMGFAAPMFYMIGKSSAYKTNFHDIADNSTNGFYPAVTGFDNATGWGTFVGSSLLPTMSAGFGRDTFTAPTWPTSVAP